MSGARVIAGDAGLPPGFAHPHASEEARRLAERGTILRVQVGSGVHGTAQPDRGWVDDWLHRRHLAYRAGESVAAAEGAPRSRR